MMLWIFMLKLVHRDIFIYSDKKLRFLRKNLVLPWL